MPVKAGGGGGERGRGQALRVSSSASGRKLLSKVTELGWGVAAATVLRADQTDSALGVWPVEVFSLSPPPSNRSSVR